MGDLREPGPARGPVAEPAGGRKTRRARGGLGRPGVGGRARSRHARPRKKYRAGLRRRPEDRRALFNKSLERRSGRDGPGLSVATLRRRLSAIASRHTTGHHDTPTDHPLVRRLVARYPRSRGTPKKKKDPFLLERVPALLLAMPDDLPARRDRALLLLGYAGAFRDVPDLKFSKKGLYVLDRGGQERPPQSRARALRSAPAAA